MLGGRFNLASRAMEKRGRGRDKEGLVLLKPFTRRPPSGPRAVPQGLVAAMCSDSSPGALP